MVEWRQVGQAGRLAVFEGTRMRPLLAAGLAALACLWAAALGAQPSGKPLPGQIVVNPKNPAWLVRYDAKGRNMPFFLCGPGDHVGFVYRGGAARGRDPRRRPDEAD